MTQETSRLPTSRSWELVSGLSTRRQPHSLHRLRSSRLRAVPEFYFDKHNGRKLTWLWQLCKGEIKANYIKNAKVPYTFQVSTYQMAILLLFNETDTLDYSEIKRPPS